LGNYEVNPTQITKEIVTVFRKLLASQPEAEPLSHAPETTTANTPISIDDGDLVSSPPSVMEECSGQKEKNETVSWESFRREVIPASIKSITFGVDKEAMSLSFEEKLRDYFPGVLVTCGPSILREISHNSLEYEEQQHGVNSKNTELEDAGIVDVTSLEHRFRDQEPQVTNQSSTERDAHVVGHHFYMNRIPEVVDLSTSPIGPSEESIGALQKGSVGTPPKKGTKAPESAEQAMHVSNALNHNQGQKDAGVALSRSKTRTKPRESPAVWSVSAGSSVAEILAEIKLQLCPKYSSALRKMLVQWQNDGELKPWATHLGSLQQFYMNMVHLYILDHHEKGMLSKCQKTSLASAVLVQFQATAYQHNGTLPELKTVVYAFKYLPYDSPLCQWILIEYGFLWDTLNDVDYRGLKEVYPELNDKPFSDTMALIKLFYGTCYVRDQHTQGYDEAVLSRWCEVHNHNNTGERALCDKVQPQVQEWLKDAKEKEEQRRLKEALSECNKYGNVLATRKRLESLEKKSKTKKKKRGGESAPAQPKKKIKKDSKARKE
jgi:hypothetical protein